MDKFGIFNLLSSLLNGNNVNSDNKPMGDTGGATPFSDNASEYKTAENRATFPPLQNSMLSTMKSHDEFVKRVKARNIKQ